LRSAVENEFASPVVPSSATPSQPSSMSRWQWATKASWFGVRSALSGVKAAQNTPRGWRLVVIDTSCWERGCQ
jgi:hypothetical protein